jgi:hypothetical protein
MKCAAPDVVLGVVATVVDFDGVVVEADGETGCVDVDGDVADGDGVDGVDVAAGGVGWVDGAGAVVCANAVVNASPLTAAAAMMCLSMCASCSANLE